jgi:hypothetical protein
MEEQDEKTERIPKIFGGALAAVIGTRLDPAAAIVLGAMGYQFESLAQHSWAELAPQARRRVAQMLAVAALKLGCDDERLGQLIGTSDETVLMTGLAMAGAERTTWPDQIAALGRLLADGLISEGDAVLLPQYALNVMVELGRLDVGLLDLLVRHRPGTVDGEWAACALPPAEQRRYRQHWEVGERIWREDVIVAVRPELTQVLPSVIGTLTRHGLAAQVDKTPELAQQLDRELGWEIKEQSAASGRQEGVNLTGAGLRHALRHYRERTWVPMQLGEIVYKYYLEAAEQNDD